MRQRLRLAAARVLQPGLLLLDEPLSHLDSQGTSLLADLLAAIPRHTTVLIAGHRREEVDLAETVISVG